MVSQKSSNGDRKLQFFELDYNFTRSLCKKIHLWAKIIPIFYLLCENCHLFKRQTKEENAVYKIRVSDMQEQSVTSLKVALSASKRTNRSNILHCTKKTQTKTKRVQWRLLVQVQVKQQDTFLMSVLNTIHNISLQISRISEDPNLDTACLTFVTTQ